MSNQANPQCADTHDCAWCGDGPNDEMGPVEQCAEGTPDWFHHPCAETYEERS